MAKYFFIGAFIGIVIALIVIYVQKQNQDKKNKIQSDCFNKCFVSGSGKTLEDCINQCK